MCGQAVPLLTVSSVRAAGENDKVPNNADILHATREGSKTPLLSSLANREALSAPQR